MSNFIFLDKKHPNLAFPPPVAVLTDPLDLTYQPLRILVKRIDRQVKRYFFVT